TTLMVVGGAMSAKPGAVPTAKNDDPMTNSQHCRRSVAVTDCCSATPGARSSNVHSSFRPDRRPHRRWSSYGHAMKSHNVRRWMAAAIALFAAALVIGGVVVPRQLSRASTRDQTVLADDDSDQEEIQLQQQLDLQMMLQAQQEAEQQNELAQQEAQQAEQQGLLVEQEVQAGQ